MARVLGAITVIGLCVLFLIIFDVSCSSANENKISNFDINEVYLRTRRQTTDNKSIPETNSISSNLANIYPSTPDNKTTDVKQEPPGGANNVDSGSEQKAQQQNTSDQPPQQKAQEQPVTQQSQTSSSSKPLNSTQDVNVTMAVNQTTTTIDGPYDDTTKELKNHNITKFKTDYHDYYHSKLIVSPEIVQQYWESFKNIKPNVLLSQSHRRAVTINLSFDFPFYGHLIRNITVTTGGFIYTGENIHSWLAATQYIAPLMANFDTRLSNISYVKFADNGTAFTVLWENVSLQEKEDVGKFTFSATLHKSGDIVFAYFLVPIQIETIEMDQHPVKVGLSDAYVINKMIFFARRKTIYEYHRVNFESLDIRNSTIIYLNAQPTCLAETDCSSCLDVNPNFKCYWCPTLNKCSTGTDRKRQDWLLKACDRMQITEKSMCPELGAKGNNAAQLPPHVAVTSEATNHWLNVDSSSEKMLQDENSVIGMYDKRKMQPQKEPEGSSVGLVLGFMLPICLIMSALIWVLYAYRNPHTKSGQLLIQYRPSQWSWRRGEARYTAATIHM